MMLTRSVTFLAGRTMYCLLNQNGLCHKILIVTFIGQDGASCRALQGTSTMGRGFCKKYWLGLPLVRGDQITTFVPKTGVKSAFLATKSRKNVIHGHINPNY